MPYKDPAKKKENNRLYRNEKMQDLEWRERQRARAAKYRTPEKSLRYFQDKIKADPKRYAEHLEKARSWQRLSERNKTTKKKYKAEHRSRTNELQKIRYHQNVDKSRAIAKKWYAENREKILVPAKIRSREWRKNNPEKHNHLVKKHRARKMNAPGNHTLQQWLWRVQYFGWRCFYCQTPLDNRTLTKDHRIALANGGADFSSNLVPACKRCNSSKGHLRKVPYLSLNTA